MTTAPRFDLDPPADEARDTPPGPLTAAVVVGGGFVIGGPFGLLVAVLALVVWHRQPRWLGGLLVGLLVLAALGSVVGAWPGPDSLRQSFADDRSWGAAAGLGAGVALLVAVARAARADRATGPTLAAPPRRADLATRVGPWLPVAGIAVVAGAVSLVLAPDALAAGGRSAAEALRAGSGLGRAPADHHPPLALVVAAVFPSGLALVQAVLSGATSVATVFLGTRLGGRRTGLAAGAVAAALPLVWGLNLSGALAGLLVVTALLLAWPDRLTVARASTAGVVLVAAALARPEALLVLAVVIAWVAAWPDRRPDAATTLAALVGWAAGALLLAAVALQDQTGVWWPARPGPALVLDGAAGAVALAITLVAVVLAADELRWRATTHRLSWGRHLPWLALPALAAVVGLLAPVWHRDLTFALGPLVAVAAAARLTRLWTARAPEAAPAEARA
ncbi:MAG: hypothetical protein JNK12_06980 [Acidimicrobiales bacterium]|nr:hypothetical protein [Acidimicrobiales bacterium]